MGVSRRKQREIVAKSLYIYEVHKGDIEFENLIETSFPSVANQEIDYARNVLYKTIMSKDEILNLLNQCFHGNKTIKDVHIFDLAILQMAISEMLYFNVDANIAINEAIEICKKYSSDISYKLINGILETVKTLLAKT